MENLEKEPKLEQPAYASNWEARMNNAIGQILDRKDFTYDASADPLYRQYKDRYVQGGKMAMMDTLGQASTLTGGYGNSYAQSAGQQAYQGYMQGLNDKIPELYRLAADKYDREGNSLYQRYSLMNAMENRDYDRYQQGLDRTQLAWENAYRLYQLGVQTPEVLGILGIPQEPASTGGWREKESTPIYRAGPPNDDDDNDGGFEKISLTDLVNANKITPQQAVAYAKAHNGSNYYIKKKG